MRSLRFVYLLLLLIFLLLSCSRSQNTQQADRSQQASRLLDEAVAEARSGQTDKALTTLDKALTLDPDWLALYYNKAVIYSVKGLKDKEENYYREVIRRAARAGQQDRSRYLSAAYYNLAFIEAQRRNLDQAFADLGRALKLTTDVSVYYHDLVGNRVLRELRDDRRFIPLMRQYWPNYARQTGRLPAAAAVNGADR